jgi:hypothetical protein
VVSVPVVSDTTGFRSSTLAPASGGSPAKAMIAPNIAAVSSTQAPTKSAIRLPGKFGFILVNTNDEHSAKTMKTAATTKITVLCPVESALSTRAR